MQSTQTHNPTPDVTPIAILPSDPDSAVNALIKVTQNLLNMADKEEQALAQNDMLAFAILQDEKETISERYTRLSAEFRERLVEFRTVNKATIDRLDNLQKLLGEKTRQNNETVSAIYNRAKAKTENTLLAAQEIAQNVHVRLAEPSTDDQGKA